MGENPNGILIDGPKGHFRVSILQLMPASRRKNPGGTDGVPNHIPFGHAVVVSGIDKIKFLNVFRRDIQTVSGMNDVRFHPQLNLHFRIFSRRFRHIPAHVREAGKVQPVENMSRPVIRDADFPKALRCGRGHVLLNGSLAVVVHQQSFGIPSVGVIIRNQLVPFGKLPAIHLLHR